MNPISHASYYFTLATFVSKASLVYSELAISGRLFATDVVKRLKCAGQGTYDSKWLVTNKILRCLTQL
jgi:hypothetical protein